MTTRDHKPYPHKPYPHTRSIVDVEKVAIRLKHFKFWSFDNARPSRMYQLRAGFQFDMEIADNRQRVRERERK